MIISPFTILIVCWSTPYIVIWGLLSLKLQTLIILIQPLSIAIYSLAILGLIKRQFHAYILMCLLIRKYIQVTRSSLYRRQYPFNQYIFQVYLLKAGSYIAIIQYFSRSRLLNKGRVALQFKFPQLYCTIVIDFIVVIGPVTYWHLPFMSRASRLGSL